jgi:putative spermidine/putrescine transport system permease protein
MNWYFAVLKKYAVFNGRARRKEYWTFFLFNLIIYFVLRIIESNVFVPQSNYGILTSIYLLVALIPGVAVAVRRMHDTNHSGWWLLVPIVNLIFAVSDGQRGDNWFGPDPKAETKEKRGTFLSWFWMILGILYFFLPLVATFLFSLRAKLGVLSFQAYENVFNDPQFVSSFLASVLWAFLTIIVSVLIFVPTAYWVRLKVPQARAAVEFVTLLPFVVPAIVFVFGLVRTFSQPPFLIVDSPALLVAGYTVLSMPYMYRAVDTGLRSIDVRTLTEAAQSLGAGWGTILFRIILPNIRVAILSGAFLSFAIVMGELILAQYLVKPAFAPYMAFLIQQKAFEPAALAVMSFALTWASMGIIQVVGRGGEQAQIAGGH